MVFNPRPAGGGAFERPPPLRFFEDSEKTAARSAAGFSPTLPPIFSATFVKISAQGHVRSGHQVRSSDPTTKYVTFPSRHGYNVSGKVMKLSEYDEVISAYKTYILDF